MARAVAIVGSGQTKHGRRDDVSFPELIHEAVERALQDVNMTPKDIDAVVSGSMPAFMEGMNMMHLYWSDALGGYKKPHIRVATCGTTGMSIAQIAYYHVASGMFDVVLAVGGEKMHEGDPQGTMNYVADPYFSRPFMSGAPGIFAWQTNEYSFRYGVSDERIRNAAALISVDRRDWGLLNPYAHVKTKVTVEDVLKARIIAYPVRLLDVCPSSDGACAVIFCSEKAAKKLGRKVAWVRGVGYAGDEVWLCDGDKVYWESAVTAAKAAYSMAGIKNPIKELDVAEIYNPFTFQELIYFESFGFCDKGKACELVEKGVILKGGELPCDPSGGVLCSNPIGATGLIRVAEASMQVTGNAGDHQIPGAKTAFSHAMGCMNQINGVMIVSSEL